MGLLENQIKTALVLQKSRAVLIGAIKGMRRKYARNPQEDLELYTDLLTFLDTAVEFGKLNYLHESLLKDDQTNTQKEG